MKWNDDHVLCMIHRKKSKYLIKHKRKIKVNQNIQYFRKKTNYEEVKRNLNRTNSLIEIEIESIDGNKIGRIKIMKIVERFLCASYGLFYVSFHFISWMNNAMQHKITATV